MAFACNQVAQHAHTCEISALIERHFLDGFLGRMGQTLLVDNDPVGLPRTHTLTVNR